MDDAPALGRRQRSGRQPGGGRAYQRTNYFQQPGERQKYYGIKRQIGFQRAYPLRDYTYAPMLRGSEPSLQMYGATRRTATDAQKTNRDNNFMSGRGRYSGKGLYKGRGGFFGRALGSLFGQGDAGDKLGDMAWNAGKSLLPAPYRNLADAGFAITDAMNGKGLYKKRALYKGKGLYRGRGGYAVNNLITDSGATSSAVVPQFNPTDLHEITYSNREYICDISAPVANTAFSVRSVAINPGLIDTFPWLAQCAINFEEYELVQLAFTFKSTVADYASASGQVGQIVMATQYNPNSDPFADKEEMMLYEGGASCKTTESLIHGVECDPSKNAGSPAKFVRAGSLPPTEDLKNYDLGKTSIAILNCPSTYAGQQLGELWVSYTVKLRKPKLVSGNAYNIRRDIWAGQRYATPVAPALPLSLPSSALLIGARNSMGCILTPGASGQYMATGDNLIELTPTPAPTLANTIYQYSIRLPDSYTGIIRFRTILLTSSGDPTTRLLVTTNAVNSIFRFSDVPYTNNAFAQTWQHVINTNDTSAATGSYANDIELHLRIQPPVNAVPNILTITSSAIGNLFNYAWPIIEISQYNSFLSVQDNGTRDRLDLITSNGQVGTWA